VSLAEGVAISGGVIGRRTGGTVQPLVPLSAIRLLGPHLVSDVAAATAVASIVGVDGASMTRAVSTFAGLEHALEPVAEIGGVRFVNDSKATNVDAARRAIESFDEGLVVIMGGRFKGGVFRDLADALAARHATVIAIGEASGLIHEAFADVVDVRDASDMPSAVRTAFACAAPGRTVVLAPACASFDMFRDYAERGKVFKQEVRRLQDEFANTREQ
jgi:UDP-N-acetylmuramoylalanine--D-glutamate ligase